MNDVEKARSLVLHQRLVEGQNSTKSELEDTMRLKESEEKLRRDNADLSERLASQAERYERDLEVTRAAQADEMGVLEQKILTAKRKMESDFEEKIKAEKEKWEKVHEEEKARQIADLKKIAEEEKKILSSQMFFFGVINMK